MRDPDEWTHVFTAAEVAEVGLYKLNPVDPWLESASPRGFNP
jgi:hypothetical protein